MQRFSRFGQSCVRIGLALWLAALCVFAPTTPGAVQKAHAQPPDDQLGESLSFVILFPQLRSLPAPTWFQPGVRVSYEAGSANFQGGGAGGGIVQYDVLGTAANWGIASTQSFNRNPAGAWTPSGPAPKIGLPAVGEFWIHPLVLGGAEGVANQNLTVTRFNKNYLSQTVPIVRFQAEFATPSGISRTVWEFDANTGLLMFYSQSLDGVSASQLSVIHFRNRSGLITQGTRAPNWVRPGAQLNYSGVQSQTVTGSGTFESPYAIANQIVAATPIWSLQSQDVFLNNSFTGRVAAASGIGQIFGALWLPQGAPARIPGQETIIDVDPVTNASLSVGRTQANEIFVREANQAYQTTLFYDPALGALTGIDQSVQMGLSTMRNQLRYNGGSNLQELNNLPGLPDDQEPTPNDPIESDLDSEQTVNVDLPDSTLTAILPARFVDEEVELSFSLVIGLPTPPPDTGLTGDAFALQVISRANGTPILTFNHPVILRTTIPALETNADATSDPALYHRTQDGWQRLESEYDAEMQTVTASHDRAGVYAVFVEVESGNNPTEESPTRAFLPALQR